MTARDVIGAIAFLLLGDACGRTDAPRARADSDVLYSVGAKPRVVARIDLAEALGSDGAVQLAAMPTMFGGQAPAACGVDLAKITKIELAIGEPLRIAARIDGSIDVKALTCVLGPSLSAAISRAGVTMRDLPRGVAIERDLDRSTGAVALAASVLSERCHGASCVAATVGPPGAEITLDVESTPTRAHWRIAGPGFHAAAVLAAAVNELRPQIPALATLSIREDHGALVADGHSSGNASVDASTAVALALALREHLVEAFEMPSVSMVPTLLLDDQFFVGKGPLLGPLVPGDLVAYKNGDGRIFVKRMMARGGQVVSEDEHGLSIDGKPLPADVITPDFVFESRDEDGTTRAVHGAVSRENLGTRSYRTLHTLAPRGGTWQVPDGELFLVGDNRENSYDSRASGPISASAVVGRVLGIWLATRDGLPDWNRIGTVPN